MLYFNRVYMVSFMSEQDEAILHIISGTQMNYDIGLVASQLKNSGWIIHPVTYQGQVIGGIIQKGAEIHTSIAPEYQKKWNPRPYINSILYPALEKYGEIKSVSQKKDERGLKWLIKLGFVTYDEDDNFYYLRLQSVKYKHRPK